MARRRVRAAAALAIVCALGGCGATAGSSAGRGTIRLTSSAFGADRRMPIATTCDGANVPPPLRWSALPRGALELAMTLEDIDAPGGSFTHWAVAGLDPHSTGLPAGAPPGAVVGVNDFGRAAYGGPCPPRGGRAHRYRFVIYALRTRLGLESGFRVSAVGTRLARDTLAVGSLTGTYGR